MSHPALAVVPTAPARPDAARAVRAGVLGNLVDQLDIFVPVIALAAVPALTGKGVVGPGLVLVATMLGRPLGAVLLGPLADRLGRARTARLCLLAVAACTLAIACLPASGGAGVVGVLLGLRLLSGIFLGGQYSAAIPLALEWAAPRDRGRISGLAMAMSPTANALVAVMTWSLQSALGADYRQWGWRVPFVVAALAPLALAVLGREVADRGPVRRTNPWAALARGRGDLLQVLVLMSGLWLFTNMAVATLTPRLKGLGLAPTTVTAVMLAATACSTPAMFLAGHWSTRIGRRRTFALLAAVALVAAPALYLAVVSTSSLALLTVAAIGLQLVTVTAYGPVGAYLAERFPADARSTGYGVAYSVSLVLPALYPWYLPVLQDAVGADAAVAGLLALGAVLLGVGALLGPEPATDAPLP